MIRSGRYACLAFLLALPAVAQEPLSAIPWLSDSLRQDQVLPDQNADTGAITSSSLDAPQTEGIGILSPRQTGLPFDLWGQTSRSEVVELIFSHPEGKLPEAQAMFQNILLAKTRPPSGPSGGPSTMLARIDRLLSIGALDAAEALIAAAGINDPELFRRAFDVGVLTNRPEAACAALRVNPALSPTFPARIFCLARANDGDAAALTLRLGHELGAISPEEELLLARFLDPQAFEDEPDEVPDTPLTALDYALRDAVALARPQGTPPLAFEHLDLEQGAPMRARITAGERLVKFGSIAPTTLFQAYRAGRPAASGSIWERASAVQALDRALASRDGAEIAEALSEADEVFSNHGLRVALAKAYAARLANVPRAGFPDDNIRKPFELLLLAGELDAAERWQSASPSAQAKLLFALADPEQSLPSADGLSGLERMIVEGLTRTTAPNEPARYLMSLCKSDRKGEGILGALALLRDGFEVDPDDLQAALFVLSQMELGLSARRIGLEKLLLRPPA